MSTRRALLFTILASFASISAGAPPVGIGTGPQGSLVYRLGTVYAQAIQQATDLQARVQPTSGARVMLPLVNSGELDVGIANSMDISDAYEGRGPYAGHPAKNLRVIADIFPLQVGFFVQKDSPIRTIADLRGKRVPFGYANQPVIATITRALLANGGLSSGDVKPVLVPTVVQGVDSFTSGSADVAFAALVQPAVVQAAAKVGGIRFIPLVDTPAGERAMQKLAPATEIGVVNPRRGLAGIATPTPMMQYQFTIFTNESEPAGQARALTEVLLKQKKQLGDTVHFFRALDLKLMYNPKLAVPYHEGALEFYRSRGVAVK